jgi:hypothetical protein
MFEKDNMFYHDVCSKGGYSSPATGVEEGFLSIQKVRLFSAQNVPLFTSI